MKFLSTNGKGLALCLAIAIPAWLLGQAFPIIGGPIISILLGMLVTIPIKDKTNLSAGIKFTSKKILQWAVILLGFGLNLGVILETGVQSLPIIICTITTSLVIAWILQKTMHMPSKIATLIGVGSSICGGSAVAAIAPVIDAEKRETPRTALTGELGSRPESGCPLIRRWAVGTPVSIPRPNRLWRTV